MNPVPGEQLLGQLEWRYAVKVFDPAREIPEEDWSVLERALVLTPSSFGLQPWHFVVLRDLPLRERLMERSWGQRQVVDCSHYVVMAIRRQVGEADIDRHLQRVSEVRGVPLDKLEGFRGMLVGNLVTGAFRPIVDEWATRQVYIALGNLMTAAAALGIDTCPMEGFDPAAYDDILGLRERGLSAVVCCAAGFRAAGDRHAGMPKVRFAREDVIERR